MRLPNAFRNGGPRSGRRGRRFRPLVPAARLEDRALLAVPPVVVSNGALTGQDGVLLSANLANGANQDGSDASTNTYTVDWGDGTTSSGTVTDPNHSFQFSVLASHMYADESSDQTGGVYTITITVTNHNGTPPPASASVTTSATITEGGVTVAGTGTTNAATNQPVTTAVANFSDDPYGGPTPIPANTPFSTDTPADYKATIDWGDATPTTTGNIVGGDTTGHNPGSYSVFGSHTYSTPGSYTVTTTINPAGTEGNPNTVLGTAHSTIVVGTPPPPVQTPPHDAGVGTINGSSGQTLSSVLANFNDLDDAGVKHASDYTATVDWGDGTPVDTTTVIVGSNGYFSVFGSHKYTTPGIYTASITINETGVGNAIPTPVTDQIVIS